MNLSNNFLINLFSLARFSHVKKYILKTLFRTVDPYQTFVLSKDKQRSLNIWALKQIKHRKKRVSDDLYFWEFNSTRWLANLDHIYGLYEYLNGSFETFYSCQIRDKVVLDVGGYIGDTALYFLKRGAKRVIIYEPVEKNVLCMRYNVHPYKDVVEIEQKAVAERDGEMTIHSNYPPGHIGFGNRQGRYHLSVMGESFHSILSKTQADIAKVDCEGNEKYLLGVEESLLRRIPYWMIEIHDNQLSERLNQKFLSAGFEKVPVSLPAGHLSIAHFRLPE